MVGPKPLSNFIMRFPKLETLDLCFDLGVGQAGFAALTRMLTLPKIQTLKLSGIDCLPEELSEFFHVHHNALKEVILDSITIDTQSGGSWRLLLDTI